MSRLVTSPGILLRSHPYSESSRILRFLTPEHGIVAVVGKGVRKGAARGGGAIETFHEGTLTFAHREGRDLHTLTDFHPGGARLPLGSDMRRFVGASLLAELVLAHQLEEGDPALYTWIRDALGLVAGAPAEDVPGAILAGAWRTLAHFGFAPALGACLRCGRDIDEGREGGNGGEAGSGWATGAADGEPSEPDESPHPRFDVAAGGLRCAACRGGGPRLGPKARDDLRALIEGRVPPELAGAPAHLRLLERYALHHLGDRRPFRSFGMLAPLLEQR